MTQKIIEICSPEECRNLRAEIDVAEQADKIKIWRDDSGSDIRIFRAETKIPAFQDLYGKMVDIYTRERGEAPNYSFLMVNRVTPKSGNLGSGGGWHRDSWANQQKVFSFLSDVGIENGPFEYLPGTGNLHVKLLDMLRYGRSLRTPEDRVAHRKSVPLLVNAGEGIFLDTTVLHRGRPIQKGRRYAATLYAYNLDAKRLARIREKFDDL